MITAGTGLVIGDLTSGNITFADTTTTAPVTLAASQVGSLTLLTADAVIDANATLTADITVGTLLITANDGIGSGDAIETDVSNLTANNLVGGNVQVTEVNSTFGDPLTVVGVTSEDGDVVLASDNMEITGTIDAGSWTVTLMPTTARPITLDDELTGELSLTDDELGRIIAGVLVIGDGSLTTDIFIDDQEIIVYGRTWGKNSF